MTTIHTSLAVFVGAIAWLLLGIFLLILIRITPPSAKPLSRESFRLSLSALGWLLVAYPLIALSFVTVPEWAKRSPFLILPVAIGASAFVALACAGAFLAVPMTLLHYRRRQGQQRAMLWTLAAAADRGIALTPVIDSFAAECRGPARWKVQTLARFVAAGTPLPDALAFVGGMVPRESLVPIRVGQDLGALSAGLRQATAPPGPQQTVWDQLAGRVAYLCLVILWTAGVSAFMMLRIAPAFQKIFKDFGAQLPAISTFLIGLTGYFGDLLGLFVIAVFFLFFYVVLRYLGIITWDLPFLGRITRRLHSATVLESLALAAERNQPFPKTIATLARCYPKWSIRWRLQGALVDVTTGTDWAESLETRGLISRADRAVLQAAQRVGNLAWALRETADGTRRRLAYRYQAWLQILFPAAVVSLALVVMAFWTAYFLPLIALIQRLT